MHDNETVREPIDSAVGTLRFETESIQPEYNEERARQEFGGVSRDLAGQLLAGGR
ncbi:hypothetical protein VB779_09390 [Haloarculaceae archaeon H-GB11]|nr:hypothetical protein [Haloarculaceae archaeon H-GB11]